MNDTPTKSVGIETLNFAGESAGLTAWERPMHGTYYVYEGDRVAGFLGTGPKGHFYISIFQRSGEHFSYLSEQNIVENALGEIRSQLK